MRPDGVKVGKAACASNLKLLSLQGPFLETLNSHHLACRWPLHQESRPPPPCTPRSKAWPPSSRCQPQQPLEQTL